MKNFFDKYGNLKANSHQDTSENPSTFNAIYAILLDMYDEYNPEVFDVEALNRAKWETNEGHYYTMEFDRAKYLKQIEEEESGFNRFLMRLNFHKHKFFRDQMGVDRSPKRFSHDETTGVVCSSFYFGHQENLDKIETFTEQTWYRFYDVVCMTRYAKDPFKNAHLIGQIIWFAKNACASKSKDHNGNYHASGKLQAWLRVHGLMLEAFSGVSICTEALPEKDGWVEVFRNYFPEEDHPINDIARKYYGY